jgi:hypothetical protein
MISFHKSPMSLFRLRISAAIGFLRFPYLHDYTHLTNFLEIPVNAK